MLLGGKRNAGAFGDFVALQKHTQKKRTTTMSRSVINESRFNPLVLVTSIIKETPKYMKIKVVVLPMDGAYLNEQTKHVSFLYEGDKDLLNSYPWLFTTECKGLRDSETIGDVIGFRYIPQYSYASVKEKGLDTLERDFPIFTFEHLFLLWGKEYTVFVRKEHAPKKAFGIARLIDFSVNCSIDVTGKKNFFVGASAVKEDELYYPSGDDLLTIMYQLDIITKELPDVSVFDEVLRDKVAIAEAMNLKDIDKKNAFFDELNASRVYSDTVGPSKIGPFYFHMCPDASVACAQYDYIGEKLPVPAFCDQKGRKFSFGLLDSGVHEEEMPKFFSSKLDPYPKCGWRFYVCFAHARVKKTSFGTDSSALTLADLYNMKSHSLYFAMLNPAARAIGFPENPITFQNMVSRYWPHFSFGFVAEISAKRTSRRPERTQTSDSIASTALPSTEEHNGKRAMPRSLGSDDDDDEDGDEQGGEKEIDNDEDLYQQSTSAYSLTIQEVFGPVREFFENAGIPISVKLARAILNIDPGAISRLTDLPSIEKERRVACLSELTIDEAVKAAKSAPCLFAMLQFGAGEKVSVSLWKALSALTVKNPSYSEVGDKVICAIFPISGIISGKNELEKAEHGVDALSEPLKLGWRILKELQFYDTERWDQRTDDQEIASPLVYATYPDPPLSSDDLSMLDFLINTK